MSWGVIRAAKEVMVRTPTKIKIPTRGEYVLPNHDSYTARVSHHRLILLYSFKCGQTEGVETPTSSNAAELNGRPNHSILCNYNAPWHAGILSLLPTIRLDSVFNNLN